MKRFWKEVMVSQVAGGWQLALDGRALRTQGSKAAQLLPTWALAELLAGEWRAQSEEVDPQRFPLRDLADYALDQQPPERELLLNRLMTYAETDTLLYRADPEDALYRQQLELWEPLVLACEARRGVSFQRVSGIIHRAQPEPTLGKLRDEMRQLDRFTLTALEPLASIAASLIVALAVLEDGSDPATLFAAAHLEADWQTRQWGDDAEASEVRALRLAAFETVASFALAARAA